MRTIKLLAILATMLLCATASFAQSVYYDNAKGGVVIDCTMMPKGTVLTASKEVANDQLPFRHTENDEANMVYPKLVVATEDLGDDLSWDTALDAAIKYEVGGKKDWRLPNQRELMLIWVLRYEINEALSSNSGTPLATTSYLSSTYSTYDLNSNSENVHWYVYFGDGGTGASRSAFSWNARAVREISLN